MPSSTATAGKLRPASASNALLAAALIGACALGAEVTLWRTFSAVLPYHLSFSLVALCPLGLALGAAVAGSSPRPHTSGAAPAALATGIALLIAPLCLVRVSYVLAPFGAAPALRLALAALAVFALFAAIGIAHARLLQRSDAAGVLAAQLLGAAAAALVLPALLARAPAPTLLVALALPAGAAAALLADRAAAARRGAAALALAAAAVLAGERTTGILYLPPHRGTPEPVPIFERWTPTARVLVYPPAVEGGWASICADRAWIPAPFLPAEAARDPKQLMTGAQSIAYALGGPGRTLLIGGRERDLLTALASGQREIDVLDFDPAVIDASRHVLAPRSGLEPYSAPGVRVRFGDPRTLLAGGGELYDHIQLPFTMTGIGDPTLGFWLRENSLYTVEAFDELLDRLSPGGLLAVSQSLEADGHNALRATVLALGALERRGVTEPARHVMVVLGSHFFEALYATVLVRGEPFSDDEVKRVEDLALERAQGLAFAPRGPYFGDWQSLADSVSPERFCADHPTDVCAPSDRRPFFFQSMRLGKLRPRNPMSVHALDPLFTLVLSTLLAASGAAAAVTLAGRRQARRAATATALFGTGAGLLAVAVLGRCIPLLGLSVGSLLVLLPAGLLAASAAARGLAGARLPRQSDPLLIAAALAAATAAAVFLLPVAGSPPARFLIAACLVLPGSLAIGAAAGRWAFGGGISARQLAAGWAGMALAWPAGVLLAARCGLPAAALAACLCFLLAWVSAPVTPGEPVEAGGPIFRQDSQDSQD